MNLPYQPNDIVGDRYCINQYIGKGGMQHVYLAQDKLLNRLIALKTPQQNSSKKRFHKSAILSAKINHPNVAKTLDYFEDNLGRAHLIEEYIDGQDLQKAILEQVYYLDPFLVARIFHHLAKGLAASHHAEVVHRDLKPTNIMIGGDFNLIKIKITDFGIAKLVESEINEANEEMLTHQTTTSGTVIGAIPYMAPEVINNPSNSTYPADVWSVGAIVYECLTGNRPFGEKALASIGNILQAKYDEFPSFVTSNIQFKVLSEEIIKLIKQCLSLNPDDRPTADQLVLECGKLCYQIRNRHTGKLASFPLSRYGNQQNYYGFIHNLNGQQDAFYHADNVFGAKPKLGENILYSKYPSNGQERALPIIKLR